MGPIWSKVIEVKGQICFFFCLFLPGPWANLHQFLWEGLGRTKILAGGVHCFKGQGHRGQSSNFCISAVLGPICMKLAECIQVDP